VPRRGRTGARLHGSGRLLDDYSAIPVVPATEGVSDALAGGVGLPVYVVVHVDLQQDRDAVPGAAGAHRDEETPRDGRDDTGM